MVTPFALEEYGFTKPHPDTTSNDEHVRVPLWGSKGDK